MANHYIPTSNLSVTPPFSILHLFTYSQCNALLAAWQGGRKDTILLFTLSRTDNGPGLAVDGKGVTIDFRCLALTGGRGRYLCTRCDAVEKLSSGFSDVRSEALKVWDTARA